MVKSIVTLFWDICCFRAGPQDVPDSWLLGIITIFAFVVLYLIQFTSVNTEPAITLTDALLRTVSLLSCIALFSYAALILRKVEMRFLQTFSAIIGTQALLSCLTLPMMLLASILLYPEQNKFIIATFGILFFVVMVLLNVWHLMITAHIYRNALNVSFIGGMLISIGLMGFTLLVFKSLGN